jgi:hypothetical protein
MVADHQVDFYWPGERLVVEVDGRAYHTSPRAFSRDRRRDVRKPHTPGRPMSPPKDTCHARPKTAPSV